jgi:hypothetical protein
MDRMTRIAGFAVSCPCQSYKPIGVCCKGGGGDVCAIQQDFQSESNVVLVVAPNRPSSDCSGTMIAF